MSIESDKEKYREEMERHSSIVEDGVAEGADMKCDYYLHHRIMSKYYLGALSALTRLEEW